MTKMGSTTCVVSDNTLTILDSEGKEAIHITRINVNTTLPQWEEFCSHVKTEYNTKRVVQHYEIIREILEGKTGISYDQSKVYTFKFNRRAETMNICINGQHADEFANDMILEIDRNGLIRLYTQLSSNNTTGSYTFRLFDVVDIPQDNGY